MRREITVAEFVALAKQRPNGLTDIFDDQDVFVDADGKGWQVPESDHLWWAADAYMEGKGYNGMSYEDTGAATFGSRSVVRVSALRWTADT